MRKILCLVLTIVLASNLFVFASSVDLDIISECKNSDVELCEQYALNYFSNLEGFECVESFDSSKVLLDVETDLPTAVVFSFENNRGYAIFGLHNLTLYQASYSSPSPYENIGDCNAYYNGYYEFYYKKDNKFYKAISGKSSRNESEVLLSDSVSFDSFTSVMNDPAISNKLSVTEKLRKIDSVKNINSNARATTISYNEISDTLDTTYINGLCGPTSAYVMLKYKGRIENGFYGTAAILRIADYTGEEVTLDSLRNGMNNYMRVNGNSGTVSSRSFSFSLVQSEINSNEPITLGTSGRYSNGVWIDGHVQTIWAYRIENDGVFNIYKMYCNDSHGSNMDIISYQTVPNSWLADHVYFTS